MKKWSHGYHEIESRVFAGSTISPSAIAGEASRGVSLSCGSAAVDCSEDWLHPQDLAGVGESSRSRGRLPALDTGVGTTSHTGTGGEVKELRRANEILKLASAFFAQVELDRRCKRFGMQNQCIWYCSIWACPFSAVRGSELKRR